MKLVRAWMIAAFVSVGLVSGLFAWQTTRERRLQREVWRLQGELATVRIERDRYKSAVGSLNVLLAEPAVCPPVVDTPTPVTPPRRKVEATRVTPVFGRW